MHTDAACGLNIRVLNKHSTYACLVRTFVSEFKAPEGERAGGSHKFKVSFFSYTCQCSHSLSFNHKSDMTLTQTPINRSKLRQSWGLFLAVDQYEFVTTVTVTIMNASRTRTVLLAG